ncbi:MAG: amidohydrolase [Bacteroidales bacterium]
MNDLIEFRRTIHKNPEISGEEKETARRVRAFIDPLGPDRIYENIGGYGLAFVFEGKRPGQTLLFRCELDGLPIEEVNDLEYVSTQKGKGHLCGHDGHMTIMAGFAKHLSANRPDAGKVILLFQPAEETGEGAYRVIQDPEFENLVPDYAFALHNLPGYPHSSVVLSDRHFASASKGVVITLQGKTSHAGEPERGINPAMAVSRIIRDLTNLYKQEASFKDFVLITFVHIALGEIAFGTSAGYAEVRATLRSYRNDDMHVLSSGAERITARIAEAEHLKCGISFVEEFPATVNDPGAFHFVEKAAEKHGLEIFRLTRPKKWSEDFGHFTDKYPGVLFGLGSGEDQPDLHNPDYDFPEQIIGAGIQMYSSITDQILNGT